MVNSRHDWSNPLAAGGGQTTLPDGCASLSDPDRLETMRRTGLLDSRSESPFDRLTRLAATLLDAPIAFVSLVESDREFLKSSIGLPEPWASRREMPLAPSFCEHVVASHEPLIVNDARDHNWLRQSPAVNELGAGACLAIPLLTPEQQAVGYFCVIHRSPHIWSEQDVQSLSDLANLAMSELALHAHVQELNESQKLIRSIAAGMPAELYLYDLPRRRKLFSNHYAAASLGYSVEEFYTLDILSHIHPEDIAGAQKHFDSIMRARNSERYEWEFRLRHKKGQWRWFRSSDVVFSRSSDGAVEQVLGVALDVTEHKDAEAALRQAEERQRLAINAARLAYWTWDLSTNTTTFLGSRRELFGQPDETPYPSMQAFMDQAIHPDDKAKVQEAVAKAVREHAPYEVEFRVNWPDGSTHWLASRGDVSRGADGRAECLRAVSFDITERKQAEEVVRAADQRKSEFLATLGHELRTPLAAIRSAAMMLEADFGEETLQWVQGVITRQTTQLSRLVDDLLDVSRIAQGKVQLRKESVDVTTIIQRATEAVRPLIERKQHLLLICLDHHPLIVEADPSRLEQVCVNLLTNAAKYSDDSAQIRIETQKEDGYAIIRVRDTGMGIAPEKLSRIFDLFEQVHSSVHRSQGGLGIGLSLVRKLVELHGGTVIASSDGLGKGSEFVVKLPLHPEQRVFTRSISKPPLKKKVTGSRRVLVVDDHYDTAHGLARLLQRRGYEVKTAEDGSSALQTCREFHPQVVLLDIALPDMDGYAVARQLREEGFRDTELIALSGYGQDHDRANTREAGFNHHFVKPVDLEALMLLLGTPSGE